MECEHNICGFCQHPNHPDVIIDDACEACSDHTAPSPPVVVRSGIGDRMAAIIERETGEHVSCTDCSSDVGKLNFMSAADVLTEIDLLAERIQQRAKDLAPALYQRLFASLAPVSTQNKVKDWIREACNVPLAENAHSESTGPS